MASPTIESLLDVLRTNKNRDHCSSRLIELMKKEVEPQIKRMTKAQLAEELACAIYAMYYEEAVLYAMEDNAEAVHRDRLRWKLTSGHLTKELQEAPKKARQRNAKNAADTRHSQPGGSNDKREKIRERWASGGYNSRNACAMVESERLYMSYDAARKALRNTPAPQKKIVDAGKG
ncbi:MAG: hypothetical protein PHY16_08805 [Methylobacter sp.]|nr:hypothetical protein [Methylobacter sp.]